MNNGNLTDRIIDIIFSKKGYDVKVLDLRKVSSIADEFIICSADSDTQVKAIADSIDKDLRDDGIKCYHKEGYETLNWVILDYIDVIVHVFKLSARNYYNLEKFWGDAPSRTVEDNPAPKE